MMGGKKEYHGPERSRTKSGRWRKKRSDTHLGSVRD